jgi:hypothetical protein
MVRVGVRIGILALCGLASSAVAEEITTLTPQSGAGSANGVVLVRCSAGATNTWRVSRGAILDLDLLDTNRDVVLTTAHGLTGREGDVLRDCRVLGPRGRAYRIESAWRAASAAADSTRDWAVLLVKRRVRGDVARLPAAHITVQAMARLAAAEVPVRLVRGASAGQGDCNLYPFRGEDLEIGRGGLLMFYSCRRAPGLSGSPILASIDGRPLVIGIHVGWSLTSIAGAPLRSVAVGQPIDAEIAGALAVAVARARE